MKKRTLILLLAGLLPLLPTACGPEKEAEKLTVMSFNVRNSHANDGDNAWDIRRVATPAMLEAVRPDIFGVQEAYPEQEQYITENCQQYVAFGVGRNDGADDGERMSILYNQEVLEMEDGGTWWLSETPDVPSVGWDAKYPRTATWALMKVRKSGKRFYFVNTHLDHKGVEARRNSLLMIVGKIREMDATLPMVLTGDLNVEPGDPCLTALDGLMINARTSAAQTVDDPSFNGYEGESAKIIDYIFYSGFSAAESFRVVNESFCGIPFISDHYPIVSTLIF